MNGVLVRPQVYDVRRPSEIQDQASIRRVGGLLEQEKELEKAALA